MARYDKYEPKAGGFRAPLAVDMTEAQVDTILGVGLDASGHLVIGPGASGFLGVICLPHQYKAAEVVDVMTDGDIVDLEDPLVAGATVYVATADGAASATELGGVRVGAVVGDRNGPRLVVRFGRSVA